MLNQFFEALKACKSPFQTVEYAKQLLLENGFEYLDYGSPWELVPGQKYVLPFHDSTLFAFTIGQNYKQGQPMRMAAAHTDFPCLRVKPNPDFKTKKYAQLNVEVYGGPILNTWLDRPLGIAGRVMVKGEQVMEPKSILYQSQMPLLTIPNLAIHLNPDVNKGVELNKQTDLMPIMELLDEDETDTNTYFMDLLSRELNVSKEDIYDFELCLYAFEEPMCIGAKRSFISSQGIDNISSVFALLQGCIHGETEEGINLIALFDHEEIGNRSKQGAGSLILNQLVHRILNALGNESEQIEQSMYHSVLLSADVAHASHPNKMNKMDITNQPVLGGGLCIKEACAQTYATDAKGIAMVVGLCREHEVSYQKFVNRSDIRGGGTLGTHVSSLLPVLTIDIGIPILAMHSCRELMGCEDFETFIKFMEKFFKTYCKM